MLRAYGVGLFLATCWLFAPTAASAGWIRPARTASTKGRGPELLLTFDDGPDRETTPVILATLRAHRVQALFFWLGHRLNAETPDVSGLVQTALQHGHVIANHSMAHTDLCGVAPSRAARQIDRATDRIESFTHIRVAWFRSPYGHYCRQLVRLLHERGLRHVFWDWDGQEWRGRGARELERYAIAHLRDLGRHGGRAVWLLHDTKRATMHALPHVLAWLVEENRQRVLRGQAPIRMMAPADLAREQLGDAWLYLQSWRAAPVRWLTEVLQPAQRHGTITR